MQAGSYYVKAKDDISGLVSIDKSFNLSSASATSFLEITYPTTQITLDQNQTVFFEFIDKMILSSSYPITNSQRNYKYLIDLSNDNGATWQNLTTIQGTENINTYATLHYFFTIGPAGTYKIRVKDFYVPSNFKISSPITITNIVSTSNINVSYNWDSSYTRPSTAIAGIAADGAARFFLVVSKINQNLGAPISSIRVNLNDAFNQSNPSLLGRVTKANQFLLYSSEANGINTITATNNISNLSQYVFWYLSPDDFVGADPNDQYSSTRFVNVIFTINYSNGTTETVSKKISIVRPPLMLVHGLASDHTTWDNFSNGPAASPTKFLTDYRFKQVSAIDISPNASFALNAFNITIGQPNDFANSFPGVISNMRNKGYVCNRVDYVCHSMGGCVLRSALDNYLDLFKRNGGAINRPYKNYEKGYVNKVITIGTPHFGSPVADIINRYVSGLPLTVRLTLSTFSGFQNGERTFPFMFIKQDGNSPWYSPQFVATDAVKNLQINSNNGGVNFQQAYIRAHVIAGDIIPGRQLNLPGGLIPQSLIDQVANMGNNYLERFVNYLLNYAVAHETDPVINAAAINALSKSEPIDRALTFLENLTLVLDVANYGTFMPESDLIVGVGSQTAGFTETNPNVSIVDNFVAHAIIHSETKNLDIGNYVMQQLNTPINSSAFNLLPATPSTPAFPFANHISLTSTVSNADTLIAKTDTNRIIIVQPINNSSVTVDNLITVRVNIKDTLNLKTINLYFQDKTYKLAKTIGIINLQLQVSSNAIGNQKISVEGFYDYQDSSVLAIDDKNLNILNHESINSFSVSPEIINLSVGEKSSASFVAIFQTFTISSSSLNYSLIITVNDTNIIRFDTTTHEFYAKKIGETFATIGYLGTH